MDPRVQPETPDPYSLDEGEDRTSADEAATTPHQVAPVVATDPQSPAPGETASGPFTTEEIDGVHILTLIHANVLDAMEIERLGKQIGAFLKGLNSPRVIIDLQNVRHLSSAALGMFITLHKMVVDEQRGRMALSNVSDNLLEVFRITQLQKLINLHPTREDAISAINR